MHSEKHLLLIDDDAIFTGVLARGFERKGFVCDVCHSGEEAIVACRQIQPSHILLDLNMPGASGLVVLPDLLAQAPSARLVVLTGYSSIATAVEATRAGAINYLCKPATIAEILHAFEGPSAKPSPISENPPSVERLEWEHIQRVLNEHQGNISATARALNMHRRTLQRKLQKRPVRQ